MVWVHRSPLQLTTYDLRHSNGHPSDRKKSAIGLSLSKFWDLQCWELKHSPSSRGASGQASACPYGADHAEAGRSATNAICHLVRDLHSNRTNMAMEHGPFEDVFSSENGQSPSLTGGK